VLAATVLVPAMGRAQQAAPAQHDSAELAKQLSNPIGPSWKVRAAIVILMPRGGG
jgi:hypothetical protein